MAAMSVVLLVIAGYMFWHGDSGESPRASDNYTDSTVGSDPTTTPAEPETSPSVSKENAISAGGLGGDPFSTSYEFDNTMHKVVFRATSDGPLGWIGYRVRVGSKGGKVHTLTSAQSSWSTGLNVNGPRPLAQMAVQVSANASYARCTVFVDGKQASTFVAHGTNSVVVCTA